MLYKWILNRQAIWIITYYLPQYPSIKGTANEKQTLKINSNLSASFHFRFNQTCVKGLWPRRKYLLNKGRKTRRRSWTWQKRERILSFPMSRITQTGSFNNPFASRWTLGIMKYVCKNSQHKGRRNKCMKFHLKKKKKNNLTTPLNPSLLSLSL